MRARAAIRVWLLCLGAAGIAGCGTSESGVHRLRAASNPAEGGYYKIGQPYEVDGVVYTPAEDWTYDETGIASWYGPDFHGLRTANGELYDMNEVTAAHKTLPMPSLVRVTNLENGRTIVVRVNDRGPFLRGRILDLSRRAAQLLGFERVGTAKVHVQILARESMALAEAARHGQLAVDLPGIDPDSPPPPPALAFNPTIAQPSGPPAPPAIAAAAPPAVAVVDERSVIREEDPGTRLKGDSVGGRFLPAPKVTLQPVRRSNIYIQAGAFSVAENAERLRSQLGRIAQASVAPTTVGGHAFYRVRVGPIGTVEEADQLLARIAGAGAQNAKIVVD